MWVNFVHTQCLVHILDIVVGSCHWDDSTCFHEHGEFPQWSVKVVDYTATLVLLACEPVIPCALWQVNVVADVIALCVHRCLLIDRSYKEVRTIHVLVACCCTHCEGVGLVLKEYSAYHWFAVNSLACYAVCVGHKLRLHLHVCAVD